MIKPKIESLRTKIDISKIDKKYLIDLVIDLTYLKIDKWNQSADAHPRVKS